MAIRVTRPLRTALGIALGGALLGGAGLYASPTLASVFDGSDAPDKKVADTAGVNAPGVAGEQAERQGATAPAFRRDDIANYDLPPLDDVMQGPARVAATDTASEPVPSDEPSAPEPVPSTTEPTPPVSPSPSGPVVDPSAEPVLTPSGEPTDPTPPAPGEPTPPSGDPTPSAPAPSDEPPPSEPTPTPSSEPTLHPSAPEPSASEPSTPTEPTPSSSASSPSPTVTPSEPGPPPPVTPPVTPTAKPPVVDKTAPTGSFRVSSASLWIGQAVTVSQAALADNVSKPAQISRTVSFGDRSTRVLKVGETRVAKVYAKPGRYKVTVTLRDLAGNSRVVTAGTVVVTTPAGRFKVNKASVWHGEKYTLSISGVAAGTSKIVIDWADGWTSTHPGRNKVITSSFTKTPKKAIVAPGAKQIRATYFNSKGRSASFVVARVTLKRDSWRPVIKVTKPKNADRASSWRAVSGTATDKGSGIAAVELALLQVRGAGLTYCYTTANTWKRVELDRIDVLCPTFKIKVVKGKWSKPIKKVTKGYLIVGYAGTDWAGNLSNRDGQALTQKLNRN